MDITASLKKAPRWAWYTAGGVAVGAGVLRLYSNRTTSEGDVPLEENTGAATVIGTDNYGPGGSPVGIIVPPVLAPSSTQSDPTGTGTLAAAIDGTTGLVGTIAAVLTPVFSEQAQTIRDLSGTTAIQSESILGYLAGAGSAPAPAAQNPTPLVAAAPAPIATAPKPKPPTVKDPCIGEYPLESLTTKGDCYKKVCSNGKTKVGSKTLLKGLHHVHKNGRIVHMSPKC